MNTSHYNILLIDDDEDDYVNIKALCSEIPGSMYSVSWKQSYQEGLQALQDHKFDACLLDHRLGSKTGLELLQEYQKLGIRCPVIFLTGQSDFDLDIQAMQVGAADYLVKGQLTAPLLERSIRYSIKQALDMEELRDSRAQILQQDRLASLGLLASSLAHEIGTPLGVIRMRSELVAKKAGENDQIKNDMQIVVSQIDRITKLVNSLLHLARGKHSEHASKICLNEIVSDVINLLQHEFTQKSIAIDLKLPDLVFVKAESGPLGQVLLNLLINSIHAIEDAKKSGKTEAHKIALEIQNGGPSVSMSVQDTGCGISSENLPQIFKPFFTTKDVGQGTGLGLATSYKIVQSWGGSIGVESRVGIGTRFNVLLPSAN